MRLERAHQQAFQEYLSDNGTNRLYKKAVALARQHPLPAPARVKKIKRGLFSHWKEDEYATAVPKSWALCGVGRKGRYLVVVLSVLWTLEDGKSSWKYPDPSPEDGEYYPTFTSDEVIYPLTPQQAMWVGAKELTSKNEYAVCWGTLGDVEQLQREFPFPVALPSI
jgi:hypothetical protein